MAVVISQSAPSELHILSSRKLVLAARGRVRWWSPPPPPPSRTARPSVDIGHCFDRGKVGSEAGEGRGWRQEEVLLNAPPPGKSPILKGLLIRARGE